MWISLVLGEPLVHFFLAAALLLLGYHLFGRPEVRVSAQLLNGLKKDYETRAGRPATEGEVERISKEYLESEILFREALRTGLVRDNQVRNLLIYTMRTSLRPILPMPSDEALEALRKKAPEAYRFPAKLSFEHISFSNAKNIPAGLLEQLRSGASPQQFGERMQLASPMPLSFTTHLEHLLGPKFMLAVEKFEVGVWSGPVASARGIHFIKIIERQPERDMPMSEIRPTLVGKWNSLRENEAISEKVAEVLQSYRVIMPPRHPQSP